MENDKTIFKNIKSIYILKKIFSFLNQRKELNIIIYNKSLNKRLNISIDDYKKCSGKLKVGESNGYGKEYNLDKNILLFEGNYQNKKRNGQGKEYYPYGKLKFEGEYLNGKRNGKGKEYRPYGDLQYEGEHLNGKRNGKGKYYSQSPLLKEKERKRKMFKPTKEKKREISYDFISFDGEFLNDKKWNGEAREYNYKGELILEYDYINGRKGGIKKEYEDGFLQFEYEYVKNGLQIKKEFYKDGTLKMEGECLNYEFNGKVKEYYHNGQLKIECEYQNGLKNGKSKEFFENGELYFEGEYLNDKRWNGKGKEYYEKDKIIYELEFINDKAWEDKNNHYLNDFSFHDDSMDYCQNMWEPEISENHDDDNYIKFYFNGKYLNGERWNGKIKEYYKNNSLKFEGEYINGVKKGKEYPDNKDKNNYSTDSVKYENEEQKEEIKEINLNDDTN